MAVTSKDFFESVRLDFTSDKEMRLRNAASRIYYSLYHKAICELNIMVRTRKKMGVHESVIRDLFDTKDPVLIKIAAKLKASKDIRVEADYFIDDEFTLTHVETVLGHASVIEQLITQYNKGQNTENLSNP